jgi:hypothetical protein
MRPHVIDPKRTLISIKSDNGTGAGHMMNASDTDLTRKTLQCPIRADRIVEVDFWILSSRNISETAFKRRDRGSSPFWCSSGNQRTASDSLDGTGLPILALGNARMSVCHLRLC